MTNKKEFDRLLEAAWQRHTFAREKYEESGREEDWHAYCRAYSYVSALEDARLVFSGCAVPQWVESVRLEMIRRFERDGEVNHALEA